MQCHFMTWFLEGIPEFIQLLFSHCTEEETEALGGGLPRVMYLLMKRVRTRIQGL